MFSLLILAACAEFPELDDRIDSAARAAPYPALVPLGGLLDAAAAQSGTATAAARAAEDLPQRIAALNARAAALRGPVIDPPARARLLRGVQ